jgi:hypothetical protein
METPPKATIAKYPNLVAYLNRMREIVQIPPTSKTDALNQPFVYLAIALVSKEPGDRPRLFLSGKPAQGTLGTGLPALTQTVQFMLALSLAANCGGIQRLQRGHAPSGISLQVGRGFLRPTNP